MSGDLIRLAVAVLVGAVAVTGYTAYRIWDQGNRDEARAADAVVVLGAAQYNGRPSPLFRARIEHAVRLYREGIAPLFIVTGGRGLPGDETTEAEAARSYALTLGVPAEAILVEDESRTTYEQLRTVGAMLRERGLRSAVLVSDRSHMLRSLRIARDQGIEAFGSPTTTSPNEGRLPERVKDTVHEIGGLGHYFLTGAGS
jgi:uncharacterized SAM-binding protein YcdF (DUF218 family)